MTAVPLPPGPRIPAVLQTLGFIVAPVKFIDAMRRRYGDVVTFSTSFDDGFVMVFDPEDIKTVFRAPPDRLRAGEANALLGTILGQRSVLLLDLQMSMTSTPVGGGLDSSSEAHTASPECHPPRSPSRALPVQREAEKVEGRATPLTPFSGRPKGEATGLLRVEGQAKRLEPLLEHVPHIRRVVRVFEA